MPILKDTDTNDRQTITEGFVPFSNPTSVRGMIVGNDLDSVVSACFLKARFGWDRVATYDLTTLWYSDAEQDFVQNLQNGDYVAIDLDIYTSHGRNLRFLKELEMEGQQRIQRTFVSCVGLAQTVRNGSFERGEVHIVFRVQTLLLNKLP